MTNPDTCLLRACAEAWEESFHPDFRNQKNCSGFVKSVAKHLGIPIPPTARADEIVDHIEASWKSVATGAEAARQAASGVLVIVGLRAKDHSPARNEGHVAVVVAGALYRNKYPTVWGGSTGSAQSKGTKSVGEVWATKDRDHAVYFAYAGAIPVCGG